MLMMLKATIKLYLLYWFSVLGVNVSSYLFIRTRKYVTLRNQQISLSVSIG